MSSLKGVAAFLLGIYVTMGSVAASEPSANLLDQLLAIQRQSWRGDCKAALPAIEIVLKAPEFAQLPDDQKLFGYNIAVGCALHQSDRDAAYQFVREATTIQEAQPNLWDLRFLLELQDKRLNEAVDTLNAMAVHGGQALNGLPSRDVNGLYHQIELTADKNLQKQFLRIVTAPSYVPNEPFDAEDLFKRDYALFLVANGQRGAAFELVSRMTNVSELMKASVDPSLQGALPADFDGRAALEGQLERARRTAASHPGSLFAVIAVSRCLRFLGRAEEALATLQAADPAQSGRSYTDLYDAQSWWWDSMGRSYLMLGRYDDTVRAFRAGMDAQGGEQRNVNQKINLGFAELAFGHPDDAIATVSNFDRFVNPLSAYGAMQVHLLRGCAKIAAGHASAAAEDRGYVLAHEADDPSSVTKLLACIGDVNAAAASLSRRLSKQEWRVSALLDLSEFDSPPATEPQGIIDKSFAKIRLNRDVQAAAARVGGVRRFHLQRGEI